MTTGRGTNITPGRDDPAEGGLLLVQEAHHRIANQLTQLAGQIQTQIRSLERRDAMIPKAEALLLLRGLSARVVGFGRHQRHMAQEPEGADVDLGAYLLEICSITLSQMGLGERVGVSYRLDADCFLAAEKAHLLALAMCEILMNAVQHAHPAGLPVRLSLACARGDGHLLVEFADDGVGLPEGFDTAHDGGMGFRILRALAAQASASLTMEADCLGLTTRFSFSTG